MSVFEPAPPPWPSRMLADFRIVAAVASISFGTMKLLGFGGVAVLLGLLIRPVAFVLSGEMGGVS